MLSPSLHETLLNAAVTSGEAVHLVHSPTTNQSAPIIQCKKTGKSSLVKNALCCPVYDGNRKVIALMVAINHKSPAGFDRDSELLAAHLCTQVSEAMDNLYRRPEEVSDRSSSDRWYLWHHSY